MTIYAPALAGLGEVNPYTADWRTLVGAAAPAPTVAAPPPKTSWLDSALSFADKGMDFLDRNTTKAVSVMEKYGQAKARTKLAANRINYAYDANVNDSPRFLGADWIPGVPNLALIGAGAGLLVLVLVMKKGNA